jgi:hypothetical protein
VHVITVNDYLAERDANWMRPIYEFLGLSVAFLSNDMDNEARKPAYACDVLYATNSEVGFDYLRDNMARSAEEVVQRPLNFAMVDEVDNILIDEARTPLIISAQVAKTDRALRRQQMAQTCNGLARVLMPAVTDREIEILQDSLSERGRIDIDALMQHILRRGAFTQATSYLIESYLVSERSARVENAAHLLDVADEYAESGLIDATGRAALEATAVNAVRPEGLRVAWEREIARLSEPFARAYSDGIATQDAGVVAHALDFNDDAQIELSTRLSESTDQKLTVAQVVSDEMARRGLIEENAVEGVVASLNALDDVRTESAHATLMEAVLHTPGGVQEADTLLHDAVVESGDAQTPEDARRIINALEQISLRGLLPFETTEKLWEAVRLTQGQTVLRREIAQTIEKHPGQTAQQITQLSNEYSESRRTFLEQQSETLRGQLAGHESIANKARAGASAGELRHALQNDLSKSGEFAEALKVAKKFGIEQNKVHETLAASLVEEMAQWVEVPRDAAKVVSQLLGEGGKVPEVRDRILLAVRDLPGENTELPLSSAKRRASYRSGAARQRKV